MSETNPVLLPSGATALELIQKLIFDNTTPVLVPGTNLFMGYEADTPVGVGLVYMVIEGAEEDPGLTFGTAIAYENYSIQVVVYGEPNQYTEPKLEAMRLRYLIAAKGAGYTALGLRLINCTPRGTLSQLGKDPKERHHFMVKFAVMAEPSYT